MNAKGFTETYYSLETNSLFRSYSLPPVIGIKGLGGDVDAVAV